MHTTRRRRLATRRLFSWRAVVALLLTGCAPPADRLFSIEPVGIMGTRSAIMVVLPPELQSDSQRILGAAEAELRRMESLMSTWIESSELSRLNAAPAGEMVPLSPEVVELLDAARRLHHESAGAFDVTARPLMELWRRAGERTAQPTPEELGSARAASSWGLLEITGDGATKRADGVALEVDGIAKGYAIDRALEILRTSGASGGLVEVGGDLRAFGVGPEGAPWSVGIRSPWTDRAMRRLELTDIAVCTSGGYARFTTVGGRRYAEILDPATGLPIDAEPGNTVASVTVLAPTAADADAWATALAVLGPAGFELLPPGGGVEALVILGDEDEPRMLATDGFPEM